MSDGLDHALASAAPLLASEARSGWINQSKPNLTVTFVQLLTSSETLSKSDLLWQDVLLTFARQRNDYHYEYYQTPS